MHSQAVKNGQIMIGSFDVWLFLDFNHGWALMGWSFLEEVICFVFHWLSYFYALGGLLGTTSPIKRVIIHLDLYNLNYTYKTCQASGFSKC